MLCLQLCFYKVVCRLQSSIDPLAVDVCDRLQQSNPKPVFCRLDQQIMKSSVQLDLHFPFLCFAGLVQNFSHLGLPAGKSFSIQNRTADCLFHISTERTDLRLIGLPQQKHHMYHFRNRPGYIVCQIIAGPSLTGNHADVFQHPQRLSCGVSANGQCFCNLPFRGEPVTDFQLPIGNHLGYIVNHLLIFSGFTLHK